MITPVSPHDETRNRKPLKPPPPFDASRKSRCGPKNRFRVLYDVDSASRAVSRSTSTPDRHTGWIVSETACGRTQTSDPVSSRPAIGTDLVSSPISQHRLGRNLNCCCSRGVMPRGNDDAQRRGEKVRKWTCARPSYTLTRERAATAVTFPSALALDGESMIGGLTPDEDLVRRLPLPLAQLYRRAHNAKTPLERHNAAYYLWEAALKLLGSVAIVAYAERGTVAPGAGRAARRTWRGRPWDTGGSSSGSWCRRWPTRATRGSAGPRPGPRSQRDDLPRAAGLDAALREALDGTSRRPRHGPAERAVRSAGPLPQPGDRPRRRRPARRRRSTTGWAGRSCSAWPSSWAGSTCWPAAAWSTSPTCAASRRATGWSSASS